MLKENKHKRIRNHFRNEDEKRRNREEKSHNRRYFKKKSKLSRRAF